MRICTPYEIVLANPSLTLHQKRATQVLKAYSTIQLLHQKHTVPCNSCTKRCPTEQTCLMHLDDYMNALLKMWRRQNT